jgi:hypothetical protein
MKYIHINRNIIQQNNKNNTDLPVCRVQEGSKARYGRSVEIHGPSKMVYRPDKPLSCGAKRVYKSLAKSLYRIGITEMGR